MLESISKFISSTHGLKLEMVEDDLILIHQKADLKKISFRAGQLKEVLSRSDRDGKSFIQVNFSSGMKILLTDTLVGFKPCPQRGLDLSKLPKVVTTPDLVSVFEAIEEALNNHPVSTEEVDLLKKVYNSILEGAEAVGFTLAPEKDWLGRLTTAHRASA